MNSWLVRLGLIALVAALVATVLPSVREWLAVDTCLDAGGVYDYATRVCRTDVASLPARGWSPLRAPDRGSLVVAAIVALAMARLFVTLDRRAKSRVAAA
jgi:hypothetical protein